MFLKATNIIQMGFNKFRAFGFLNNVKAFFMALLLFSLTKLIDESLFQSIEISLASVLGF